MNKLTLKDNTISYCFTLYIIGGLCHLVAYDSVLGTCFPLRTACLLIYVNVVSIKILSLNFLYKNYTVPL